MTPERWAQISRLYHAALARDEQERPALLAEACAGDEALRREVESLLAQPASAGEFLEQPAVVVAAQMVSDAGASVLTGRRLGAYQVEALLGAGGMGEVYRARDTKLGRDVAIKVLPRAFTADADRLARFEREARLLAALNHPHIGAIYGVEEGPAEAGHYGRPIHALVLELVEGPTLADRIARGRFSLDETLRIAKQIAEALEAAHEKGIIHRDLKPANIILQGARGPTPTRSKTAASSVDSPPRLSDEINVKVLDFGLAKVREAEGGSLDLSNSPTMMTSTPGMILGTAPYMAPEQANGKEADRTSDVWAFGCVFYEMLTGRRAFDGETVGEILANVLKTDPDWHRLPAETPEAIRRLLRRSLQKDQKLRFRDIRDARLEIDDIQSGTQQNERVAEVRSGRRERLAWASALALVALIAAVLGVRALRPAPTAPEARLEINTPPSGDPSLAISPDGLQIIFAARSGSQSQLWLRSLDSPSARPLPGTERATSPFWSPNSRSIGFFADNKLKRMDVDGGSMKTLMSVAPAPFGGAWNSDGTIAFSPSGGRPIFRVSAEGGEPSAATRFESPQQRSHASPQFLPDGRHFLFFVIR